MMYFFTKTQIIFLWIVCSCVTSIYGNIIKKKYVFSNDPIDVVIPCHSKDLRTLNEVIRSIRRYTACRRIIVVSQERLSNTAEWFEEKRYPFSKYDIAYEIFKDPEQAKQYLEDPGSRIGWLYQQLLKLYAPFIIPNISPNVLIVDADTIFLKRVRFLQKDGAPLFAVGDEYHIPYFNWIDRLGLGVKKVFPDFSGIVNHMLFQKVVLEDLFEMIESIHGEVAWKVMCHAIDHNDLFGAGFSEYELYFNFIFSRSRQPKIRNLVWTFMSYAAFQMLNTTRYDFVTCHAYLQ